MYEPYFTNSYSKDIKRILKRGWDIELLKEVVSLLISGDKLPSKNKDHFLKSNWKGFRECHIKPDWLLIYKIEENVIYFTRTDYNYKADPKRR